VRVLWRRRYNAGAGCSKDFSRHREFVERKRGYRVSIAGIETSAFAEAGGAHAAILLGANRLPGETFFSF